MAKQIKKRSSRPIRVGVIGVSRGMSFARGAGEAVGMKLVALCDTWKAKLKDATAQFADVTPYSDYRKFLEHDMDAVVLANYFHEHAPFAVQALEAGMHVMSETTAVKTLGEAAMLSRAVRKSGKVYLFAENYCFFATNQEMRRLYRSGEIGELRLGECEYIHPFDSMGRLQLAPGINHWRNWIPSTYYCTHALGPMMYITDLQPVSVNAHSIAWGDDETEKDHARRGDPGSVILVRMSNGATVIVNGLLLRGHGNFYRLHGSRGLMENLRHGDSNMLRIVHEAWDRKPGDEAEKIYRPDFPITAGMRRLAHAAGHGGGDFFTNYHFAEAIRSGRQPWLNVHRGIDMSIVGILAWRSALENGAPVAVPDFRKESVCKQFEDDHWSPYPEDAGPGQPPPALNGVPKLTKSQLATARKVWDEMGYKGE